MILYGICAATALVALLLSLVIGSKAGPLGRWLGLMDYPDPLGGRKRHDHVTPLMGGTGVVISTVTAILLTRLVFGEVSPVVDSHLSWLGITVFCLYLIGLMDDRFALSPKIRLILAVGLLLVVVVHAPDFSLSMLRFTGQDTTSFLGRFADAFSLLCLVGLLNAVNMADGKNGLVISLSLIWSFVLAWHAPEPILPVISAAIAALAVMLWFNMRGQLFLGDGGSYGISALFGLLAIYIYNHGFPTLRADHIAIMFAVPVFDTIRLMTVRMARGQSPFAGDRDHLHHHLAYRWGWPRGLLIYVALVGVPNLLTLLLPSGALLWLLGSFASYALVLTYSTRDGRFASDATR